MNKVELVAAIAEKSELTLSEMRLVLVTSRSAIIFLADKATKHMCWRATC